MNEFQLDDFTKLVVSKLEELGENITLSNPDTDETFPIGVVQNPLEAVIKTDETNRPVSKRFQINIEWWTDSRYTSLGKYATCNVKLREINMSQVGQTSMRYDEITKKHIVGGAYEVLYNGITNSFSKTK